MNIDWDLVVKIAVPLATLLLGKYLDQLLAKRPKLISYMGHASSFALQNGTQVHTHAIVVRNAGRQTANNIRIGHYYLPDYQIFPAVQHRVEQVPKGGPELIIEKLVPGEQVTLSYLYFPPTTWAQVNSYAKSDEGLAKILNVIPSPQLPAWQIRLLWSLVGLGILAATYVIVQLIRWALA
jgi:hypothetical protein